MPVNYKITNTNPFIPTLSDTIPVELAKRLGSGLAVPLVLNNNSWNLAQGADKVRQDVMLAVMTPVGRRFVYPSFGSEVPYLMFEQFDSLLETEIIETTLNAVKNWVPTVTNVSVAVDSTQIANNTLQIEIFYTIIGTNAKDSVQIILYNSPNQQLPPGNFMINNQYIFQV